MRPARVRPEFVLTLLTIGCMTLVGCTGSGQVDVPISGQAITSGSRIGIDVENVSGSVRVLVNPAWESASVSATVSGVDDPEQVWIGAESIDEGRGILRVLSDLTDHPGAAVDLTIRVPACDGVLVKNSGGAVELVGVAGAIEVDNGFAGGAGGSINVRTNAALTEPILLVTPDGSVVLQAGPGTTCALEMSSDDGRVYLHARHGVVTGSSMSSSRWTGTVNGGEQPALLRTGRGTVRTYLMRSAEGFRAPGF